MLLLFFTAIPFAKVQLQAVWAFIPVYESVLVVNDAVTALLLLGQYRTLGSAALLLLSCGYLFTAATASLHMLTFPGLFAAQGLLGAGPQSTAWLYMFWHAGFPLFVMAFTLSTGRSRTSRHRLSMALAMGGTLALAALCAGLATAGQSLLPPIMNGRQYTGLMLIVVGTVWTFSLVALLLLWRQRHRSVLHLWLCVVMLVWLIDIALSALLNAGRFDLGFYTGRLYGLLANSLVLVILLFEHAAIHTRLLATTRELRAANVELDAFAHATSHDLRSPLRALKGFAEALDEDHGQQLPGDGRDLLREIRSAGERMSAMIDGLLVLSRSTRGELRRGPVDVAEIAQRIRAELSRQDPGREVSWQIESPLLIDGDARMVEAVMGNLLDNAWKYSGRQPRAEIRVSARGPMEARCICVSDNGAGFDMARVGELFRPFRRLHHPDDFPGQGIGLATVQRIVQRHGGGLSVDSQPGVRTTFCFRLSGGPFETVSPASAARPTEPLHA